MRHFKAFGVIERGAGGEKWISILDELSEVGCKNIQFIGGEPTLYSKLPELLNYAHQKRFKSIVIFSNLSNLSEKLLKSIVNSGCKIRFSIYGSNMNLMTLTSKCPIIFIIQ